MAALCTSYSKWQIKKKPSTYQVLQSSYIFNTMYIVTLQVKQKNITVQWMINEIKRIMVHCAMKGFEGGEKD